MGEALYIAWSGGGLRRGFAHLVLGALAIAVAVGVAYKSPNPSLAGPFAAAAIGGIAIWMLASARTHLTLAVLMLYLGMADGVIKLMTQSHAATLGRDVLLYAIVVGVLVKRLVRKEPFVLPPFTGWIVAFLATVAVQLFNPSDISFSHSFASMRPHLEFIPLFFLGYSIVRTQRRIKGFLLLLIVVAAANGVASVVQFGMSPAQLASWGPGYAARIEGGSGVSARNFVDSKGGVHVRPFGLGDDFGVGGTVGLLAGPAVLALLTIPGNTRMKIAAGILGLGVILAVVTSQARTDIIAAVIALTAYMLLATSLRPALRILFGTSIALVIAYAAISILAANTNSHLFDRYASITPSKVFSTAYSYRGSTLAEVPSDIAKFPLGAGIGKAGPAANSAGGQGNFGLNAESEPTYLMIELGVPGLLLVTALQLRFMALSFRIRRMKDLQLRLLLAAVAAPLFALFIAGFAGITTATSPGSPYLWFASGILTYWLVGEKRRSGRAANAA